MQNELPTARGILELANKSDGRLRQLTDTYVAEPSDPVVASHLIQKYDLRPGLELEVSLGKPVGGGNPGGGGGGGGKGKKKKNRRPKANAIAPDARRAKDVLTIEGVAADEFGQHRSYEDLTTVMPEPRLTLEYPGCPPSCRLIDLFCPIGYGTRGMIVSPPKAGKTTLLQQIASAIRHNHPEVEVYALLIDERPEEVTDFRRNVPCTVLASSNDHPLERHVGLSMLALERCKRHAEMGRDVVVLLDSLTRIGRAFNTAPNMAGTGRTLSGGLDAGALAIPKQLFGGARKFEEGGSLTIIATALVDTGSRGDQVIFEEFKGTGNMELILDRKIAEQRTFPAIDLAASGTRNEDKLMSAAELNTVTQLRRRLQQMQPVTQIDQLLRALGRFETNKELVGDSESKTKAPA
jgi:transcription termination factor Rho